MNANHVPPTAEVDRDVQKLYEKGHEAFAASALRSAEASYKKVLELLKEDEKGQQERIHKGAPYHYLGLTYLLGYKKPAEALEYFIKAYIEDVLSQKEGTEDAADAGPAATILKNEFQLDSKFQDELKWAARQCKAEGAKIWDSSTLLSLVKDFPKDAASLLRHKHAQEPEMKSSVDDPPGSWEKRVFIGGDYLRHSRLVDIKQVVLEEDFAPIVAKEFAIPEGLTRHHTLLLLHYCRLAIFEVTTNAGQLTEIERLSDYEVIPLFLYDGESHPQISKMVISHHLFEKRSRGYRDTGELQQAVRDFLRDHAGS
ncbi:MAG: hypothetical protein HYX92_13465 [Chloroflexi bacterium]|nr:hypothetical protein [Chloroflexota bacterium]